MKSILLLLGSLCSFLHTDRSWFLPLQYRHILSVTGVSSGFPVAVALVAKLALFLDLLNRLLLASFYLSLGATTSPYTEFIILACCSMKVTKSVKSTLCFLSMMLSTVIRHLSLRRYGNFLTMALIFAV